MMFNQKTVIYIILSAILLYLYYKRGGIALFAAFVAVVAGTLFAGASAREGFSLGGRKGGDKECAKMGFTAPKIDKKDIKGSLDKILKNFKNVVEKYADIGEGGINIGKSNKEIEAIFENDTAKDMLTKWKGDSNNNLSELFINSFMLFDPYIFTPSEEKQQKFIDEQLPKFIKNKEEVEKTINGGNRAVKMFEGVKKLDETGKLDKKAKTVLNVTICGFKQTILIWKSLVKAMGGEDGGDDACDDEEDKPKKKKKTTKKKSKKTDDGDGDGDGDDEE